MNISEPDEAGIQFLTRNIPPEKKQIQFFQGLQAKSIRKKQKQRTTKQRRLSIRRFEEDSSRI